MTIKELFTAGKNTFYDDGEYYYISNTAFDKKYKLDRNKKLLKHLQYLMNKHGTMYVLALSKSIRLGRYASLPQIIYSFYSNKPVSRIRNGQVKHIDKRVTNCTIDNLYYTKDFNFDDVCRKIWHDESYIYMLHKKSNKVYTMNYSGELLYLLASPKIAWVLKDTGRLNATIRSGKTKNKDISPTFAQIVYWCYNYGVTHDNLVSKIRKLQKAFRKADVTIDHLNNDIYNNCRWNLSEMTRADNAGKPNARRYFKNIFRMDMAYTGKSYILQFTYMTSIVKNELRTVRHVCNTPRELIDYIKYLKNNKWKIRASKAGVILDSNIYRVSGKFPFMKNIAVTKNDMDIQRSMVE